MKKESFLIALVVSCLFMSQIILNPIYAEELEENKEGVTRYNFVNIGYDFILGVNVGGMMPIGDNISDYDVGIPFGLQAEVPSIFKIGNSDLNVGMEVGCYWMEGDIDKLSGIPISLFANLEFPPVFGGKLAFGAGLGGGIHIQFKGDDILFNNPTHYTNYFLSPRLFAVFKASENFSLSLRVDVSEILSGTEFGGTQEWVNIGLRVSYTFRNLLRGPCIILER
jgi:hypothetical protein